MKLQLALDRLERKECFDLLEETKASVDWIEVGTGVIKEYGMAIVREIKVSYPSHTIVADMKTCDAGKHEAKQAFEAGADIVTVMAFSADQTIKDTLNVAQQYNKRIMIDLLGITDKKRIVELENLGVDLVSLHFGKDMQQEKEMSTNLFELVNEASNFEVAVAGGINEHSLPDIVKHNPNIVIVGSAITSADNPKEASLKLKGMIN
ncbi:3-hexulose-6-phosphate synthase [Salipaludibacillus sp. CF4.18]|uniref:3-hexulose-6-phosphate synthase n=1 Tax=Salipaludibacillus sp. CF4.18 TaxID=3373081 RepID=UPI003EE69416